MVKKRNNQLPDNLPQLQNLIKRDPASYKDEFLQQQRHFQSLLEVFALHPSEYSKGLDELIMFMAQVAHCYPDMLTSFAEQLINILETHNTILDVEMRMTFCRALILLRNKGLLKPMDLLALFFKLLRCKDKQLRKFLQEHIITDIKNMNVKHKDAKLNTNLQNFMYTMLKDNNAKAAKMSVNIMIDLYRKNIWNDAKTVNLISMACFSKIVKVMVAALKFFVTVQSSNDSDEEGSSSDDDTPNARDVMLANKFNKKTRKREKTLKKVKKLVEHTKKKKKNYTNNFHAIHLIHDPQEFAEKLFNQLEKRHDRIEVKMLTLDLVSRLIGIHQLFVFNFYPYVQRYLQPRRFEVTKLLQFVAQATHELIPPDVMEPVLKTIANNFVTERNSSDVMAVGLNAVREMCVRAPLIMTEDLLRDLAEYKRYRERSVMMAAQALIHVYRNSMPTMLHKKDRGRPTEATIEIKARQYGEIDAKEFVPGAEVILEEDKPVDASQDNDDDDSDSDEWVDVQHSSDEECDDDEAQQSEDNEDSDEECSDAEDEEEEDEEDEEGSNEDESQPTASKSEPVNKDQNKKETTSSTAPSNNPNSKPAKTSGVVSKSEVVAQRQGLATEVSVTRILTDEDFKRIEAAQMSKQVTSAKGRKRVAEPEPNKGEFVNLADIENIHKKRRHDKEARLETVMKGREGREKFGYKDGRLNPFCSKTNRERSKKKAFMMIKHKVKSKTKRSFKDKQIRLRNHLLKLDKMN
ncbi:protein SDA1 homolog [Planococcus citri]|uniref:protein SDA1 homolog n=1 Tax=Planococcus citri TaxID=170843 RepID=UPI0031F93CFE